MPDPGTPPPAGMMPPAGNLQPPTAPGLTPDQLRAKTQQGVDARIEQAKQDTQKAQQKANAYRRPLFRRLYSGRVARGSLIIFNYLHWKHDTEPLVLVTGTYPDGRVAGVNMHYFTYRYARTLIGTWAGRPGFSFAAIRGNKHLTNAFRTYKSTGVRNARVLDTEALRGILNSVRSYNPADQQKIRQQIQDQMRGPANPTADQLADQYQKMIVPRPFGDYGLPFQQPDGRFNPQGLTPPAPETN